MQYKFLLAGVFLLSTFSVSDASVSHLPSANQITIPVQNLPAGQYWLRLQSGEEKQVLQFVKQ